MFKVNPTLFILAVILWPAFFLSNALAADRYTVSANGQEVKDNKTQLTWRRCPEGMNWSVNTCIGSASAMTHQAALQEAASQAVSTGVAWRLPNVKELSSIVDRSRSNPSDTTAFPVTPSNAFWSSSPVVGGGDYAWFVYLDNGYVSGDHRSNNGFSVWLVRDSQ
ncbi:MAG: DUF1566 domain-containing protein [Methylobacter sp.]|nr:MAG: DUF1566 domain-containing protein [Methylobacter sp.]